MQPTEESLSQLATIMKNRRIELGMSQGDLAMKSGFNKMSISKIERGIQTSITFETAKKLSEALQMHILVFLIETKLIDM